ncbi:COG3400 family protein [Hydrogenimonas sp.]
MKHILIVADGIVAKHFLERISKTFISSNEYTVVTLDRSILPESENAHFTTYQFDPTSYIKLSKLLKREYDDIFIIMKNRIDAEESRHNIRRILPNVRIIFFNRWDLRIDDENLISIDANEFLASRLYDFLPNVPVVAQNVGLGQGEIMEVLVPFGSAYVYRHIGTIIQEEWRIVALYRNNQLILPKPSLMIKPNDLLLLVGKPAVLESVFKAIKQEMGQFPAPFGQNLYLFIDMERESSPCIEECIKESLYLHKRIKGRKLIIRVTRPTRIDMIEHLKSVENENIECVVDFRYTDFETLVKNDIRQYNIGLILCGNDIFVDKKIRNILYKLRKPVLQLSEIALMDLKKVVVILSEEKRMEVVSSTVFDVASQLGLDVELLDYEPDGDFEKKSTIIGHYENLATIFSKKMRLRQERGNPVRQLSKESDFLQVIPFGRNILANRFLAYLSTDVEKLYFKLSKNPQLFVPVEME